MMLDFPLQATLEPLRTFISSNGLSMLTKLRANRGGGQG